MSHTLTNVLFILIFLLEHFTANSLKINTHNESTTTEESDSYLQLTDKSSQQIINLKYCGLTKDVSAPLARIVGGKKVTIKQFPWMVSFQKQSGATFKHFCGGSVVNLRWILTAGHCFNGLKHSYKKVRAKVGATHWDTDAGTVYELAKVVVHENYQSFNYNNDIALIKLKQPVQFVSEGEHRLVNTVCMPSPGSQPPTRASVYGWGLLSTYGSTSSQLMKVILDKYDTSDCNDAYHQFVGKFTPQIMCYATAGKDACQGDSGGPLSTNIDGKEIQFGIVSFGQGCSLEDRPGIYTNVVLYMDWINKIITSDKQV